MDLSSKTCWVRTCPVRYRAGDMVGEERNGKKMEERRMRKGRGGKGRGFCAVINFLKNVPV